MTRKDGVHVSGHGSCRRPVVGLSRRGRTGSTAIGLVLVAAALAGCSFSDGLGPYLVDPGHYSAYHCKQLVDRLKELKTHESELSNLIEKASEGGGGTVIGGMSYRADYEKALGEEKALRRTAADKKCALDAPAFESDQIIR